MAEGIKGGYMRDIDDVPVTEISEGFVILDVITYDKKNNIKSEEMFALMSTVVHSKVINWQFRSLEYNNSYIINTFNNVLEAINTFRNFKKPYKQYNLYFVNKLTEVEVNSNRIARCE